MSSNYESSLTAWNYF